MALLSWSDLKYSVKIKDVDEQHKKLISILNELHESTNVGRGRDVIEKIIGELESYIKYHFGLEEKLMLGNNFPGFQPHKAEHDGFIKQVSKLHNNYDAGTAEVTVETLTFLRDWVNDHITGTDKEYTAHLNSKGVH